MGTWTRNPASSARDIALRLQCLALLLTMGCVASHRPAAKIGASLSTSNLCVTEGQIETSKDASVAVNVPKMRAYAKRLSSVAAELRFTYLGPTEVSQRLGSGEMREQLGLKLDAEDACNLIYVMWRIQPRSELVVSLKTNPGLHSSSECSNHGYREIRSDTSHAIPSLNAGDTHRLLAETRGRQLTVFVDDTLAWQGRLDDTAAQLKGRAGVRSDNARFRFELAVSPGKDQEGCQDGPQESD